MRKRAPKDGRRNAHLDRMSPDADVVIVEIDIKSHMKSLAVVDAVELECIVTVFVEEVAVIFRLYFAHGGLNRSKQICHTFAGHRAATLRFSCHLRRSIGK